MSEKNKNVIIIGAGPAGLTTALEVLERTDFIPIIIEADNQVGGIAKTINYKKNRIDIGGHRFFSKSDWVMEKWNSIIPVEEQNNKENSLIMLIRSRLSRILYMRKYFDYPISPSFKTLKKLGVLKAFKIFGSYVYSVCFPVKNEKNLEDFFINRFGTELYKTFFKDYTEKVWGLPCSEISASWGSQRIKGISVMKIISHAFSKLFSVFNSKNIKQKEIETSLIEQFLYPKLGHGQLWEEMARIIQSKGGQILLRHKVEEINIKNEQVKDVVAVNCLNNESRIFSGEHFISSMPVKDLISAMQRNAIDIPDDVSNIASKLPYRDFITVGVLLSKTKETLSDNWIYVQEPDVKVGRLQIFNNWSPYLVADEKTIWIGMEYFCNENDEFWNKTDEQIKEFACQELCKLNIIDKNDILDNTVIRVPKAYPAYFGSYQDFDKIKNWTDTIKNLWLVGRNGMHRYNNMDHSMLTAFYTVQQIKNGKNDKNIIWNVNSEESYHESK